MAEPRFNIPQKDTSLTERSVKELRASLELLVLNGTVKQTLNSVWS